MAVGRRRARREALFLLYQADLLNIDAKDVLTKGELAGLALDTYTRHLVQRVLQQRQQLDELLERHLYEWSLSRLAPLEHNILRIGAWELGAESDVPPDVAIDEAVRLAKKYCSDEAAALVNGVLASVLREYAGGEADESDQIDR